MVSSKITKSRELLLPGRAKPVKISIGLVVKLVQDAKHGLHGLSVEIRSARKLHSMFDPPDIGDALWSYGVYTGVHTAISDEQSSSQLDNTDLQVEVRTLRVSLALEVLTSLELAQVGSLVRDMVRQAIIDTETITR